MNKKNIVFAFFFLAVLLLFLNIFLENTKKATPETVPIIPEVTRTTLEANLTNTMLLFGISEDNITVSSIGKTEHDSLPHKFNIILPSDVPHIMMLREYFNSLKNFEDIDFSVNELSINTKTRVDIFVKNNQKLQCTFISDTLAREYASIVFILENFEDAQPEIKEQLLNLPVNFGIFLTPSEDSYTFKDEITKFGKDYYLYIDDNLEDGYELEDDTGNKLKKTIRRIKYNFEGFKGVVIDIHSKLYHSVSFNFVRDTFTENGIKLLRSDNLKGINSNIPEDVKSRIYFHARSTESDKILFLTIDAEMFFATRDILNSLTRFGYKIITARL